MPYVTFAKNNRTMKHANTLLQQAADLLHSCDKITAVEIHRKQTERAKAVRILHQLQRYRRGNIGFSDMGYTPKQIGVAIDTAIRELRSHFRDINAKPTEIGGF